MIHPQAIIAAPTQSDIAAAIGVSWSYEVLDRCLEMAASASRLDPEQIMDTDTRRQTIARARQAIMWAAHRQGVTDMAISEYFGLHHTTVAYGIEAAAKRHEANRRETNTLAEQDEKLQMCKDAVGAE